jgi:hypothetical protein
MTITTISEPLTPLDNCSPDPGYGQHFHSCGHTYLLADGTSWRDPFPCYLSVFEAEEQASEDHEARLERLRREAARPGSLLDLFSYALAERQMRWTDDDFPAFHRAVIETHGIDHARHELVAALWQWDDETQTHSLDCELPEWF